MNPAAAVRVRRRQEALDSLEHERVREEALTRQLEQTLRDAEGWRADEEAFAWMDADDVALLRELRFTVEPPASEARGRFDARIAELEAEIAEARRRQRAYESYAKALEE